jgi:hypothetical protein
MCSTTVSMATLPAWQLSDDAVEHAIADTAAAEARLVARRAELLREAELRGLKDRTRASSTERWLRDRYHWTTRTATARLRETDLVLGQPVVHEALAAGQLTAEQATVIADALDQVDRLDRVSVVEKADAAALLLDQAELLDPRDLQVVGRELVEHLTRTPSVDDPADAAAVAREQEAAEAAAQAGETNTLTVRRMPDGTVRGRFSLQPVDAPALTDWLTRADQPHPGCDGFEDDRPRDQRRGDHLAATLRGAARTDPGQRAARKRPDTATVLVTTTLEALREGLAGVGMLATGGTLSAAELRRLACDAGIIPAVLGGPSKVLDLGRSRRDFNRAQRRAMTIRDRGCIAPGCDRAPAACRAHHQWEWADGGPTDLDNGALLCQFHHQQVHRQGWRVTLAANGYPQLTPPASIDPQQRPRQHHRFQLDLTGRHRR